MQRAELEGGLEGAVMMAMTAQERAENAEIETLASGIIEAQQREIEQMKAWRAEWYPEE